MIGLRGVLAVAGKDLRSEWRSKETVNAALSFSLVILLLFSFAFDPPPEMMRAISGGLLWLVFLFAGVLVIQRSFARDLPNDCLDVLLASPLSAGALFFGKVLASFTLLLAIETISIVVFGFFYNVRWAEQLWQLAGVTILASWGLAVVGTMYGALTVNLRMRELMLPVLIFPTMVPTMIAAISLTTELVAGNPVTGDLLTWVRLLLGFDVIYTLLAYMLADTVLVN